MTSNNHFFKVVQSKQVLQTNIKQSNHKTQIYTNKPIVVWHKAWFNLWLEVEKKY
jgi:hypothetical protein